MATRSTSATAGTGYANLPDGRAAAAAAARDALERSGGADADLVFCFHHGRHDPGEIAAGLREVVGDTPVVGGTAPGIATNQEVGYEGHQVGVGVISGLGERPPIVAADGLADRGEHAVGRDLGNALAQVVGPRADVLFLWASVKRGVADPEGAALYFGTPLIEGMLGAAREPRTVAGAGTIGSLQIAGSSVFSPGTSHAHGAVAVAFEDGLRMDTVVMHGCRPASSYHTITRTHGPAVLEIDGRPALEMIDDLLGGTTPREEYPFNVILGVNRGEKYGDFQEESYQTRLCLAIDEAAGALIMFEPDLTEGTEFQLMRPTNTYDYVGERVQALLGATEGRTPVMAIYADCVGRTAMSWGSDEEEAAVVAEALGGIPFLGFYTGVEVARVAGVVRPLDITGVLCLLSA